MTGFTVWTSSSGTWKLSPIKVSLGFLMFMCLVFAPAIGLFQVGVFKLRHLIFKMLSKKP